MAQRGRSKRRDVKTRKSNLAARSSPTTPSPASSLANRSRMRGSLASAGRELLLFDDGFGILFIDNLSEVEIETPLSS
jgi:hypothetical protein